MKIYTLRHEKRHSNVVAETSLNQFGLQNANSEVIEKLNKLNFSTVYCSSFLRCLQTVSPYLNNYNNKNNKNKNKKPPLNIEYGFCEFLMPNYFTKKSELKVSKEMFEIENLHKPNPKYRPVYTEEKLRKCIPETEVQMKNRIHYTLNSIIKNHQISPTLRYKNILIVSHMSPIAAIWNYFDSSIDYKSPFLDIKMGGILEFDVPYQK